MPRIKIKDLDSTEKGFGSDMHTYFKNTWVKVSIDGKVRPVWAKYIGTELKNEEHAFKIDKKIISIHVESPEYQDAFVEWGYPTGWFNSKKSAIYVQRVPKRQQYKGLYDGYNIQILPCEYIACERGLFETSTEEMNGLVYAIKQEGTIPWSAEFLEWTLDTKQYVTFDQAMTILKAKKVFSKALSNGIAVCLHPAAKGALVFCQNVPVGETQGTKIKLFSPDFEPEISTFFKKEHILVLKP